MGINKMKNKIVLTAAAGICTVLLSGCAKIAIMPVGTPETAEITPVTSSSLSRYEMTGQDYDTDMNGNMDTPAVIIDLSNLQDNIQDSYAYDQELLTISAAGNYYISGNLEKGRLCVDVFEDETVHLFLDNVTIETNDGAAVYVENAAKVIITVMDGTNNVLSGDFREEGQRQASVFSNCDLTINGSGNLSVYSYQADGVRSKNQLKIVAANLYVKAKEDAIRGNDGVIIYDSAVEVECEGTGIISNSDKDLVVVQGGSLKVIAGQNAIAADQYVSIRDCQWDLYAVLELVRCEGIRELDEGL